MLYNVVLAFDPEDESLKCDLSSESYGPSIGRTMFRDILQNDFYLFLFRSYSRICNRPQQASNNQLYCQVIRFQFCRMYELLPPVVPKRGHVTKKHYLILYQTCMFGHETF